MPEGKMFANKLYMYVTQYVHVCTHTQKLHGDITKDTT